MERLTRRWGPEEKQISGHAICEFSHCPEDTLCTSCVYGQKNNRLSDIEDILGDNYDLDRLRELVQADREGRCSAHSFGVDKLAWTISYGAVTAEVVTGVYLSKTLEGIEVLYTTSCGVGLIGEFYERDIGKTVFRTREEAEAALKERNEN